MTTTEAQQGQATAPAQAGREQQTVRALPKELSDPAWIARVNGEARRRFDLHMKGRRTGGMHL